MLGDLLGKDLLGAVTKGCFLRIVDRNAVQYLTQRQMCGSIIIQRHKAVVSFVVIDLLVVISFLRIFSLKIALLSCTPILDVLHLQIFVNTNVKDIRLQRMI